MLEFETAQDAFEFLFEKIIRRGLDIGGTKAIWNCGFTIKNPQSNIITTPWRKFNPDYAQFEWEWYLSGNKNADEIAQRAQIWKNMQDEFGNVNSNYGYQWNRNNQLEYIIRELTKNPNSRRASLTIYDGKEWHLYEKDTPCTNGINFYILDNKLNMSVMMRSNDLVFGFCNDQYCFSNLQKLIADRLNIGIGTYFHYTTNMHIYERHWKMNTNKKCEECGMPIIGRSDKLTCSAKCRIKKNKKDL